jgi:hypothetical protein
MSLEPNQKIQDVLRTIVVQPKLLEGLHFAVFLPKGPDDAPVLSAESPRAINTRAIERMLHFHGLRHTAHDQVLLWNDIMHGVHRSFEALAADAGAKADGRPVRLTRMVLDVEMGGILYSAVDEFGWVFAATLNQQAMNHGMAEELLSRIVHQLRGVMRRRLHSNAEHDR